MQSSAAATAHPIMFSLLFHSLPFSSGWNNWIHVNVKKNVKKLKSTSATFFALPMSDIGKFMISVLSFYLVEETFMH